ncbi:DASH complex subunit Duo1, putative [Trichophyton benhamiae CBS 112371]|uniref:DASH complex subunit DUO1 n=1 Tax=Arthroderma benhamiae (strain ATCC MYA-4681 / CBS 112371) TaxID=663331 RepID=D4AML6_ARTBC|nr:DASH complex subunit Duo1, putative [Trichophyton benhamiae CBS 112371]EFE35427.1 DASH complex subunit Duo1, putative [Trichophyton benhamiae CBS 112371]
MATPTAEMDGLQLQEKEEPGWDARTEQGSGRAKESYHQYTSEEAREEDDRETALRAELKSVRDINAVIEGVVESLERAKGNMESVARTVSSASTLLDTWTRILSQTEHNRRLVLDPSWQGASQDMADIETEARERQQEAERRELELQERKLAQERKAEEEQRRRTAQTSSTTRARRGIVRPSTTRTGTYKRDTLKAMLEMSEKSHFHQMYGLSTPNS